MKKCSQKADVLAGEKDGTNTQKQNERLMQTLQKASKAEGVAPSCKRDEGA